MEKKGTIISLIFVGFIIISAVTLILVLGITAREYNYVQVEINPRIEFLCNKNNKVISYRPLNDDASIALAGVNYKGMDIKDATINFVDTCAKLGYIDVDGVDNAINVTVIDGITQALDVHVMENINNYLKSKEIMCTVIENYEDRSMFDEKKENNICCANKYKLIKTICEYDKNASVEKLKNLSEVKLIDMVANIHATEDFSSSEEALIKKKELLNKYKDVYDKHIKLITENTQKEFSELFEHEQNLAPSSYGKNFNKSYNNWQKQHIL